ncbi:MAG TPA: hypothetical protein VGG99_09340 [Acetobacteraceae bacterium]
MSISAITAYQPWTPISTTGSLDTTQNLDCFSMASTGTAGSNSSTGNSVSGSSDPFQQLDASIQAMLLQMQGGSAAGSTQAIGQSGSVQADADTLVQAIEQSLSNSASTTAATTAASTTAASTQIASTSTTDPTQTQGTQGHHHHHHHMSDDDGGSNNGTNNASATNSTANSLITDITQAIQSYGTPSAAAA